MDTKCFILNIMPASTCSISHLTPGYPAKSLILHITQKEGGWGVHHMPVATLTVELAIEHAQSLKDRRQAVRSLKDKLRHGFNISVAELDDAMVWNRATVGIAAISSSSSYLAGQLREVEEAVRRLSTGLGCEIMDSWIDADITLEPPTPQTAWE